MSFCEHIWTTYAEEIVVATQHPFLAAAGKHELDTETLSSWLAQDRVYALHGYPKFISSLISALPLSSATQQRSSQALLDLFAYCLSNIAREVSFFDSLGPKYGLDLETRPKVSKEEGKLGGKKLRVWTRAYVDLLIATGAEAGSAGVAEGLTLLWAMEKLYFQAWTFAKSHTKSSPLKTDSQTSAALDELIDNWTNVEFANFVNWIEKEMDKLELKEGSETWERCEEIFKYTLFLEQRFWPDVE